MQWSLSKSNSKIISHLYSGCFLFSVKCNGNCPRCLWPFRMHSRKIEFLSSCARNEPAKKWRIFFHVNDHLLSQFESSYIEWLIALVNRLPSRAERRPCNNNNLPFQSTWIRWHSDNKCNLSFAWNERRWYTRIHAFTLHTHDFALRISHFHIILFFFSRSHTSILDNIVCTCVNRLSVQWSVLRVGYFLKIRIQFFSISNSAGINETKQEHRSRSMSKLIKISSQVDFHFMANLLLASSVLLLLLCVYIDLHSFHVSGRNDARSDSFSSLRCWWRLFWTQHIEHDEFICGILACSVCCANWIRFRSSRCGSGATGLPDEIIMCNCILPKIRTKFLVFLSCVYFALGSGFAPGSTHGRDDFWLLIFRFGAFQFAVMNLINSAAYRTQATEIQWMARHRLKWWHGPHTAQLSNVSEFSSQWV